MARILPEQRLEARQRLLLTARHAAPIYDQLDLNVSLTTLNGALRDNSSIWRQPPSPAVDAAWDRISTEGLELVTVTAADVAKSGKDPSATLRAPLSWGRGEGAYLAQIEVFHQIHCLNELRKEMHRGYYYGGKGDGGDELRRAHKSHCVHMLLQALACRADVGIVTHNWVRNEGIAEPKTRLMPDFSTVKKCVDFEGLLGWARGAAVEDLRSRWADLRWTPGETIVPGQGYA
ncbi:hypothetical protein UVI_02045890 [Ustilaginoidea virens]|uniref:Tat pathway signal sequence n=1 Tax=Ustilaginoidea virens TaxID=1159556 RepID=A0A1B5L8J9_USTVR|nr:hypothetical protein UVI_02045890 [Ustilaginoidea virens]